MYNYTYTYSKSSRRAAHFTFWRLPFGWSRSPRFQIAHFIVFNHFSSFRITYFAIRLFSVPFEWIPNGCSMFNVHVHYSDWNSESGVDPIHQANGENTHTHTHNAQCQPITKMQQIEPQLICAVWKQKTSPNAMLEIGIRCGYGVWLFRFRTKTWHFSWASSFSQSLIDVRANYTWSLMWGYLLCKMLLIYRWMHLRTQHSNAKWKRKLHKNRLSSSAWCRTQAQRLYLLRNIKMFMSFKSRYLRFNWIGNH